MLHPGGLIPPGVAFDAMNTLARERELMSLMLGNNHRFDPMALALANSLQVGRIQSYYSLMIDICRCHVWMNFLD